MRLKQYITETELESTEFEYIIRFIKENCQPFLKKSKGRFIYRGMKMVSPITIKEPRKDRLPRDMELKFYKLLNKAFNDLFGWKARSEGVFVSGSPYNVEDYGPIYYVFPIKAFEFIWSPNVFDLIDEVPHGIVNFINPYDLDKETTEYFDWNRNFEMKGGLKEEHIEYVKKWIKQEKYTRNNFYKAVESGNEIMLRCKEYLAIRADSKTGTKLRKYGNTILRVKK